MKALVLHATKQPLQFEDRPALKPARGEVVVQLKSAALNRRDYWITQGMYPGIELPVVLGSDGAGVVAKVGDGEDTAKVGQEVIINPGFDWGNNESSQGSTFTVLGLPRDGTLATEVVVPAIQLHAKPTKFSWHEAAALPLAGVTAFRALFTQGQLQAGETVLITGIGGGVATFTLQFAVAAGASVWVTSSSADKIERAMKLGASGGFDYKLADWSKAYLKQTNAPDLIIDSAAGVGYSTLVNLIKPGGRIVNYGATAGPPEKLDLFKVFWKQLCLQGSTMGSPSDFEAMLHFVETHDIRPIIDATFPLSEGNQAIEQMRSSPQFGKYVFEVN